MSVRVCATLAIMLCCCGPSYAEGVIFAGLFREVTHDGSLSTTPTGAVFGATTSPGAGVEVRWAADGTYQWLMVNFLQVTPATSRGKSFQPFGAIGAAVTYGAGDPRERSVGIDLGGGVLVFLTNHVGLSVDYRYFRGSGTLGGTNPVARTISFGLDWRF